MTIGSDSGLGGVILARFLIKNGPIFKKTKFFTVSPPEGVQRRVRGQNRGFWAKQIHFWGFQTSPTPSSGQKLRRGPPPPQKRRENLKQPFLGHFWSKWAGFLHETLLSHTLSGKLVTSHPTSHPPSHPSGLPPAQPPLGESCQIRPIFAGMVNKPITRLHMKF